MGFPLDGELETCGASMIIGPVLHAAQLAAVRLLFDSS